LRAKVCPHTVVGDDEALRFLAQVDPAIWIRFRVQVKSQRKKKGVVERQYSRFQ
jgi:phage gp37-like protein